MPLSKRKVTSADELSSAEDVPAKKPKTKPTASVEGDKVGVQTDSDGNAYWDLTGRRRVTISNYNGKTMVSIREYYEKDGKELPGKKGISLPLDQFSAVISLLPQIESQLKTKGINVPRPDYGGDVAMNDDGNEDAGGEAKKGKENYEETSDEE